MRRWLKLAVIAAVTLTALTLVVDARERQGSTLLHSDLSDGEQAYANRVDDDAETVLLQTQADPTPSAAFFKVVDKQPVYLMGRLGSRYFQSADFTLKNFGFVESQLVNLGTMNAKTVTGKQIKAADFSVRRLFAKDGGSIYVQSNLQIDGDVVFGNLNTNDTLKQIEAENKKSPFIPPPSPTLVPGATAFIETLSVPTHDSSADDDSSGLLAQWRVVHHDDFESGAHGWSWQDGSSAASHVDHCGNGDYFLTSNCLSSSPIESVSKVIDGLPQHTQLELSARVHFVDKWMGGAAYAKIDGEYVWLDTHGHFDDDHKATVNLCGKDTGRDRLSVPVKVIVPHTASSVTVEFGSNVEHTEAGQCIASLGVDDVAIAIH